MNERGPRVRFLPWSGSAIAIQQDRLWKCSLATLETPRSDWRNSKTQQAVKIRSCEAERSGRGHHAPWVDGKLLMELLGSMLGLPTAISNIGEWGQLAWLRDGDMLLVELPSGWEVSDHFCCSARPTFLYLFGRFSVVLKA